MAITTLAELRTALQNLFADTGGTVLATERLNEHITLGETFLFRKARLRAMEAMAELRLEAIQGGGTAGGTANALTASVTPAPASVTLGDTVSFTASATNTGAVTLNLNSLGATAINKDDGTVALEANDIINGFDYIVYYDGTRWRLVPRGGLPLPSRFLAVRRVFAEGDPNRPLDFFSSPDFWSKYLSDTSGPPSGYTIDGDYIIFGPSPDATYQARILYYRQPTALATAVPRLFTENPDLYLYSAAVHTAAYLKRADLATGYALIVDQILADLEDADQNDRLGSVPLQMRSDIIE